MDSPLEYLLEFCKFVLPAIGAIYAWYLNERRKRLDDQYQRKEAAYRELIRALKGFYVGAENADSLKEEFLNQLNLTWLYCPDDVIKKGYAFLDTVHVRQVRTDEEKEAALGEFVYAIRKDLLSRNLLCRTSLTPADFKHLNIM